MSRTLEEVGQVSEQGRPERSPEHLETILAEAEATVRRLRRDLEQARARNVSGRPGDAVDTAQHAEIDRLEAHLSTAQVHWREVFAFFEAALADLRHHGDQPPEPTQG